MPNPASGVACADAPRRIRQGSMLILRPANEAKAGLRDQIGRDLLDGRLAYRSPGG